MFNTATRHSAGTNSNPKNISRRNFAVTVGQLGSGLLVGQGVSIGWGAETSHNLLGIPTGGMPGDIIPAPSDPAKWPAWREQLREWRTQMRQKLNYNDALYARPDFAWIKTNFCCAFVMMCDEWFYDPKQGRFAVESFLDHGQREFGGYDSIVLWHAYPRIGFDERNQFDFYRDMPGGLPGLRELSRACRSHGARVFIDYNPWDTGTRREGKDDLAVLADFVGAIEADGIFLDTMNKGAPAFRQKLDRVRPGVVLEGEGALPIENIHDHHMSWAQWFRDSAAPGVLRNKWFERRHLQHQIRRWDRDHSAELQCAWMNGSGMMVWENVFGSWVGWNERDRSILRSMLAIQRRYAELFSGGGWTPLVPTLQTEVFASLWEGKGLRLWTLINRSPEASNRVLLQVQPGAGELVYDLVAGRALSPEEESAAPFGVRLSIPARGIGCVVAGKPDAFGEQFSEFLAQQAKLQPRANYSVDFVGRTVELKTVVATNKRKAVPTGMVEIPPASFKITVEFQTRECGFYESVPPGGGDWGPLHRPKQFAREVKLGRYAMDLTPVTNLQFTEFIKASGYEPKSHQNFLKHWRNGVAPVGQEDHPVVYVSLEDARAYAAWAGKRLPTEEEWQYGAAGLEQRLYPWGNEMRPGLCNDGKHGGTTAVKAFPEGRSPFGCYDMCGNIWHWTESERSDARTRFCILKGGSWFKARGSGWYADGGPVPCRFAAKFLLMWPGLDRCSTIGFRCVVDLE